MSISIRYANHARATAMDTPSDAITEAAKRFKKVSAASPASSHAIFKPAQPYVCDKDAERCVPSVLSSDPNQMTEKFCNKQCVPELLPYLHDAYESSAKIFSYLQLMYYLKNVSPVYNGTITLRVTKKDGTAGSVNIKINSRIDYQSLDCDASGLQFNIKYKDNNCAVDVESYFYDQPYSSSNYDNLSAEEVFFIVDMMAVGFCSLDGSSTLKIRLDDQHKVKKSFVLQRIPQKTFNINLYTNVISFLSTGADFYDNKGFKKNRKSNVNLNELLNEKASEYMRKIYNNAHASNLTLGEIVMDMYKGDYDHLFDALNEIIFVDPAETLDELKANQIITFLNHLQTKMTPAVLYKTDSKRMFNPVQEKDLVELVHFRAIEILLTEDQQNIILANAFKENNLALALSYISEFNITKISSFVAEMGARTGNIEIMRMLIEMGADHYKAMMGAISANNINVVKFLISLPNMSIDKADYLLINAINSGNVEIVRMILKIKGISFDRPVNFFLYADGKNKLVILRVLLQFAQKHPNILNPALKGNSALKKFAENNDTSAFELFMEFSKVDPRINLAEVCDEVLYNAILYDRPKTVRLLLEYAKADPRINPAAKNNIALQTATEMGFAEIVRMLTEASKTDERIDPGANNNQAFIQAAKRGRYDVLKILLEVSKRDPRIDPAAKDNAAIQGAIERGNERSIRLLLEYSKEDSRINPGVNNNFVFITAVENEQTEIVRQLIEMSKTDQRINPGDQNNKALEEAIHGMHTQIAIMIIEHAKHDARINLTASNNRILYQMIKTDMTVVFQKLLQNILENAHADSTEDIQFVLLAAIDENRPELAEIIIELAKKDARINLGFNNSACLKSAVAKRNIQIVRALLERAQEDDRINPGNKDNFIFKKAVDSYLDNNETNDQYLQIIRMFLEYSLTDPRIDPGAEKNYAIRKTLKENNTELFHMLLEFSTRNPRINPAMDNNQLLWNAFNQNKINIMRALLQHALIDARINPGMEDNAIIKQAAEENKTEMLDLLLEFSVKDPRIDPGTEENFARREELLF